MNNRIPNFACANIACKKLAWHPSMALRNFEIQFMKQEKSISSPFPNDVPIYRGTFQWWTRQARSYSDHESEGGLLPPPSAQLAEARHLRTGQ